MSDSRHSGVLRTEDCSHEAWKVRSRSGENKQMEPTKPEAPTRERVMVPRWDTGARQPPHDRLLLKANDVAKVLSIGRTKVYEMMAAGELPVVRIGTAVRVPWKPLLDWIENNTQKAA